MKNEIQKGFWFFLESSLVCVIILRNHSDFENIYIYIDLYNGWIIQVTFIVKEFKWKIKRIITLIKKKKSFIFHRLSNKGSQHALFLAFMQNASAVMLN